MNPSKTATLIAAVTLSAGQAFADIAHITIHSDNGSTGTTTKVDDLETCIQATQIALTPFFYAAYANASVACMSDNGKIKDAYMCTLHHTSSEKNVHIQCESLDFN